MFFSEFQAFLQKGYPSAFPHSFQPVRCTPYYYGGLSSLLRRLVFIKCSECSLPVCNVIAGQDMPHQRVSEKVARARLIGRLQPSDLRWLQPATTTRGGLCKAIYYSCSSCLLDNPS
jgi:hypothetical protein